MYYWLFIGCYFLMLGRYLWSGLVRTLTGVHKSHEYTSTASNIHATKNAIHVTTGCVLPAFQDPQLTGEDGEERETASKKKNKTKRKSINS